MKVTVVGLGKVGLPLAVQCALYGHDVVGTDISPQAVALVNAQSVPFPGEEGLAERLAEVVRRGALTASLDTSASVSQSSIVIVVVPLHVDQANLPDFGMIDAAAEAVGRGLGAGTLVVFETTLPIGTTRDRLAPVLEKSSGLRLGSDFSVAFSPERVSSGHIFADLSRYPKLVGGVDQQSGKLAVEFYESIINFESRADLERQNGVWDVGSAELAEFAKLAETTYRDVNIGLSNQFALYAHRIGVDIYDVIEACNSQPFCHLHQPGIAVGGHCIPVYPHLYLYGDRNATIVRAARDANRMMPERTVDLLESLYGDLNGARVVVLGAAYRNGVKETAFSGVFPTVEMLSRRGATPTVHDPLYDGDELVALGLQPYRLGDPVDAGIVQTDHTVYQGLTKRSLTGVRAIVDGRAILNPSLWTGVAFAVLGRGSAGNG